MDDYSHLRKAHKDEEKETLLNAESSPSDAKECLDTMKNISDLIAHVNTYSQVSDLFNLLLYRAPSPS